VGNAQVTDVVDTSCAAWFITIRLPLYRTVQRAICCPPAARWTSRVLPTGKGENKESAPDSGNGPAEPPCGIAMELRQSRLAPSSPGEPEAEKRTPSGPFGLDGPSQ